MTEWRILIVDDDREMRASLVDLIEAAGWSAHALSRGTAVEKALDEFRADVILSDVRMPGMTGLELLEQVAGDGQPPVVLISAHGDIPMAVDAMQKGAYSFVEKPYEPRRLLTILSHAAEQHRMRETNARLRHRLLALSGLDRILLGQTEAIAAVRAAVIGMVDSPAPVFIQGETGAGKELVARALHDLGPARDKPFVAVNAAGLEVAHLASLARSADEGSLFLDEIATCPQDVQAALLRLIETNELFDPVTGGIERFSLRIVSATNEDPELAVQDNHLRRDLFFRLNAVSIRLPALRDRRDDIVLLATHFLKQAADIYEITPPDLEAEDLAALVAHDWPGNVRELRNAAERRVLQARRGSGSMSEAIHAVDTAEDVPPTLREAVATFEREMIGKAIQAHEGRMDAVAEALGIGRRTLNEKIVKLGLDKDAFL